MLVWWALYHVQPCVPLFLGTAISDIRYIPFVHSLVVTASDSASATE